MTSHSYRKILYLWKSGAASGACISMSRNATWWRYPGRNHWTNSTRSPPAPRRPTLVLGFLCRNLKGCPQKLRRTGYISLVRSLTQYGAALWAPHLKKDINQLELVQRRAARWIKNDYGWRSSVTDMLEQHGLESLGSRRQDQWLILMYSVWNSVKKVVGPHTLDLKS